jgi:hypothetical protein
MLSNIKNILSALTTLAGLLKLVEPITELVEKAESKDATGAQKKEYVLKIAKNLLGVITASANIDLPTDGIIDAVSSLIDTIVSFKNLIGEFTHKSTTTTTAAA